MADDITTIKDRIDIAQLVGEYVPLRRFGHSFKALCPFHQEKTPSFVVTPSKGMWYCFGCSEGGDIFSFIQKAEGLDFGGALKLLAERAGVTITKQSRRATSERERLFDLLALAARFYHEILLKHPSGKNALEYLGKRGVTPKTIETFQIGYAPNHWDATFTWLTKRGFSAQEIVNTGLSGKNTRGTFYDRFRGRIMFPIQDLQGRVVAFGGRVTPETATGNEGKYINSPETRLYSKRSVVYNLNRAKHALRHQKACLVVEGYMDVVMLVQQGIEHVVASSGTAFTQEQIQQLKRFTESLHFAFDADAAGWKAGQSATKEALEAGMRVASLEFPNGKDPADIAHDDPTLLADILDHPQSLIALMLKRLKTEDGTISSRQTLLEELLPMLRRMTNPIQQGEAIQEIAGSIHVPESRIMTLLEQLPSPVRSATVVREMGERTQSARDAEYYLLGLLISVPSLREEIMKDMDEAVFLDEASRLVYKELQRLAKTNATFYTMTSDDVIRTFPAEHGALAESLTALSSEQLTMSQHSSLTEAKNVWRFLERRRVEKDLQQAQQMLSETSSDNRYTSLERIQQLAERLAALQIDQ